MKSNILNNRVIYCRAVWTWGTITSIRSQPLSFLLLCWRKLHRPSFTLSTPLPLSSAPEENKCAHCWQILYLDVCGWSLQQHANNKTQPASGSFIWKSVQTLNVLEKFFHIPFDLWHFDEINIDTVTVQLGNHLLPNWILTGYKSLLDLRHVVVVCLGSDNPTVHYWIITGLSLDYYQSCIT